MSAERADESKTAVTDRRYNRPNGPPNAFS